MSNVLTIGIAEVGVVSGQAEVITYALGSCIGVCLYDKNLKSPPGGPGKLVGRYADTGIPALVAAMESKGSSRTRLTAKIAGGAKMFNIQGDSSVGNIGDRNIAEVKRILAGLRIPIVGEDVGKDYARTMSFSAADGKVTIKAFSKGTQVW